MRDFTDFEIDVQNYVMAQAMMAVSDGLVIGNFDEPGCPVIYVNSHILDFTGQDFLTVLGQPMLEFLKSLSADSRMQDAMKSILLDRSGNNFQTMVEREDQPRWLDFKFRYSPQLLDFPQLLIGIVADITNEKKAQAQNLHAQKMEALGQLAGGVAHDFNNIMSIIDGYARIALKSVSDGSPESDALKKIMVSVQKGSALTGQLLSYGRHTLVAESVVCVSETVKKQLPLLKPLMKETIDILVDCREQMFVDCSEDTITQILINLCVNARDAMPEGGTVWLECSEMARGHIPATLMPEGVDASELYVCLCVKDNGAGMTEDVRLRMFDPFFTTKPQGEGTGLGLSLVFALVRAMKGFIGVDTQPGKGTSLSIFIPKSTKRPVRKVARNDGRAAGLRLEGYTVLVAEDEPDLRHVIASILEERGMTVLQAANGNEALARQDEFEGKIDFLLTDVVMPKLNGARLAALFSEVRPDSKVIFMSGYPAGAKDSLVQIPEGSYLVPKPIKYEDLLGLLGELEGIGAGPAQTALEQLAGIDTESGAGR